MPPNQASQIPFPNNNSRLGPDGRLILVSNRLPVVLNQEDEQWQLRFAAGGLATGLRRPHQESKGLWIGWPGVVTAGGEVSETVQELLKSQGMVGVGLDEKQHDQYYTHCSNRCLWPLFHYFPERMTFNAEYWETYRSVNRKFADAVLEQVQPNDLVFIQDFHLTLVPAMLRQAMPNLRIGFFLHIPFPSSEIYRIFARREEVLQGILGADVVAFHTLGYVRHFRSAARHLLGLETRSTTIYHQNREVKLMAQPLGIEPADWQGSDDDAEDEVQREMEALKQAVAGRRIILGVERLDYTKGVPERLKAFAALLQEDPSLVEKVMMIQIAVPSRVEVEEYRDLRDEVDRLAGKINSEFGRPGLQALHYQFRGVRPSILRALYRLADVCLVTPLRDGLNLVAKEFVASRGQDDGVLVLGENTGAAWELGEALRVNSYDDQAMLQTLKRALNMPIAERMSRMKPMRERVASANVHVWAEKCLGAIRASDPPQLPTTFGKGQRHEFFREWSYADAALLFLDYDGTLREFTAKPNDAIPTPEIRSLLTSLAQVRGLHTYVVSGRSDQLLVDWLGDTGIGLVAEHGASLRRPGKMNFESLVDGLNLDWRDEVHQLMLEFAARVPKSKVEEKPLGLAWHFRDAEPEQSRWQARELRQHLEELLQDRQAEVMRGNQVVEVRPLGVTKGRAVGQILAEGKCRNPLILAAGDDRTDESMFLDLPNTAWTLLIGSRQSAARFCLADPAACRRLLAEIHAYTLKSSPAAGR
ncbi:MAG: bifunctional alpha,alpha-trehalose-phosphate synthase (UDP-forming)/trehalose-phosphatase [Planctomycetes bacterium]|nr:bifunctional alpha,alpha-trehalose-phosphate synthase (UDP-forming)/trehalose-phosphatase [Planctomycetota bacterium]